MARLVGNMSNADVGARVGTTGQTVGRWLAGTSVASPSQAVALARGWNDSPLNALVALGHITPQEARQRPAAAANYDDLSDEVLLELVRKRMKQGRGEEHVDSSATTKQAGSGRLQVVDPPDGVAAHSDDADRPGDPDPD